MKVYDFISFTSWFPLSEKLSFVKRRYYILHRKKKNILYYVFCKNKKHDQIKKLKYSHHL